MNPKTISLIVFTLLSSLFGFAQTAIVFGYITDAETGEVVIAASCVERNSLKGTTTNNNGFYSISLKQGLVELQARNTGYEQKTITLNLKSDTLINLALVPAPKFIDEIVVTAERPVHEQTLMGRIELTPERINAVPTFVGETDLMKAAITLPGISGGREGFSNIFVRGGDRGQNLILLDGAKLYNTNHLGGLVSLFNTNIIKSVSIYKGGFPASFGGRVSSVIDINVRNGNRKRVQGKFNLGLLSSGLNIEGPLGDKTSFLFAIRSSYFDLFTIPNRIAYKQPMDINENFKGYSGYTFFDVNAKINHDTKGGINYYANFYSGHDISDSKERFGTSQQVSISEGSMNIHNTCITIGNRFSPSPRLFLNNKITLTRYSNNFVDDRSFSDTYMEYNSLNQYRSSTYIEEVGLQSRLEINLTNIHHIKAGIESSAYRVLPGSQFIKNHNLVTKMIADTTILSDIQTSVEISTYIEDEIKFSDVLFLNMGIRGVSYICMHKTYLKYEPRLSLRAMLGRNLSAKVNYTVMNQFNHVLVRSSGIFEKEIWLTSTNKIPSQQGRQVSVGIFSSLEQLNIECSVEAYYKLMNNLLEYSPPAYTESNLSKIEDDIFTGGKGKAFGVEFQAKYTGTKFSGSVNYTYSSNQRLFQTLNNGEWYPFLYDRPHDLSFLLTTHLSKEYTLNSNFIYATGTPFTMPDGFVTDDLYTFRYYVFSGKNNVRLPDYHRLDVSLVKTTKSKKGNTRQFSINVFNAYARQNAVYMHYARGNGKVYQRSMFSIISTISYSYEF